jgi:predicted ATPase/transcriptional regulator with XRE-family HTH domain
MGGTEAVQKLLYLSPHLYPTGLKHISKRVIAMSESITFGGWLKQRRRESGVTQEELGERIGCSETATRKIELGERRPSVQIAQLLAEYLNIAADEREAFITFARSGREGSGGATVGPLSEPGETGTRAPWRNVYLHQTNLPAVLTPLIGREQERASARSYLLNPRMRVLTLTGAPGIGKTRLALQVASDLVERFEDGTYLVELASVTDPDMVTLAVARTLGLKDTADQPVQGVLLDYVRERKMLLVLDNFEQVLDAAASIVKLLEASPWLKVLVTSREALHVRGEKRLPVHALGLPDRALFSVSAGHPPLMLRPLAALARYPSIQLFVERAQDVSPDFELTQENASDVAMLCVGLEGLPLAIELAAARVNHLSLAEMRTALADRLKLLTGGGQDLPARHRTLKSAVQWSYDLLNTSEQALFAELGAFAGGCTLAAIQAVSGFSGTADEDIDSLVDRTSPSTSDMVLALVDKNLVRRQAPGMRAQVQPREEQEAHAAEARFVMLETIRDYALERLAASGEKEATLERHARYFLALAREAQPQLGKPDQKWWMNRLNLENDNFRAALGWSLAAGTDTALEIGLGTGEALFDFWLRQGFVTEGKGWLKRLLVRLDPRLWPACNKVPDDDEALVQTLSLHHHVSSALSLLKGMGALSSQMHEVDDARRYLGLGLALAKSVGDRSEEAHMLTRLGNLSNVLGDYGSAIRYFEDSLAIKRSMPGWDELNIAGTLSAYSWALAGSGKSADALACEEESLAINRRLGGAEGVGRSLYGLAEITRRLGDYEATKRYAGQMLEIARDLGNLEGEAHALRVLGDVARVEGRLDEAQAYLTDSLGRFNSLEQQAGALDCIAHLAQVAADRRDAYQAGVLAGAHLAHYTSIGEPQLAVDTGDGSIFAGLREQEGAAIWDSSFCEGLAMTMPQVIAFVLNAQ